MRIIYLGTPDISAKILEKLINSNHEVVAVVSQPNKPIGRKQVVLPTPVSALAKIHNIPIFQFDKIMENELEQLRKFNADIMVTCAFGQLLRDCVLNFLPYGVINVHASLLPKHRGSAPVQWSIIKGDKVTGVTIMKTVKKLDAGDILLKQEIEIEDEDYAQDVFDKVALLGGDLLIKALDKIENNSAVFVPQDEKNMTYEPMLDKDIAKIDFNKSAFEIRNLIRGLSIWPVAYCHYNGKIFKIFKADIDDKEYDAAIGEIVHFDKTNGFVIKCGERAIKVFVAQIEGGKVLSDKDFINGRKMKIGDIFN